MNGAISGMNDFPDDPVSIPESGATGFIAVETQKRKNPHAQAAAPHVYFVILIHVPMAHADDMILKKSSHSAKVTLDRLEAALKEKGITVVARWDHAGAAKQAGMPLRPMEVLIFGNPKLGAPLMQSNPRAAVDLPLKVLAWEDDRGQVWVGYTKADTLAARYDIRNQGEVVEKMAGVLESLTNQAIHP